MLAPHFLHLDSRAECAFKQVPFADVVVASAAN
jgi:hypothetical protein